MIKLVVKFIFIFFIILNIKSENIEGEINYEEEYNKNIEKIEIFEDNENNKKIDKLNENNNINKDDLKNDENNNKIENENKNIQNLKNITNIIENDNKFDIKNLNILQKVIVNDKISRTLRLFVSLGFILDPTVKIYKEKLKEEISEDFEMNILSGVRLALDYIPTNVINKYIGLIRKYRIFWAKIKDSEFFTTEGLKNDYSNYIFGIQGEIGVSLPLNIRYDKINFNNDNNINKNIHSINFLCGLKFEIGDFDGNPQYVKKLFPTKLLFEIMYIVDLKKWFSFYISSSFYHCFSPVYLLSFNLKDLKNVLNTSNKFQWNLDITIGFIGLNFPI